MTRRVASLTVLGGVLLLAGVLAGCATPAGTAGSAPAAPSETPSATPSEPVAESDVDAAWLDAGRAIGLVTYGSSTCVPTATDVGVEGSVLGVTLEDPDPDQPCTRDFVPRARVVELPPGFNPSQNVEIVVSGSVVGSTQLEGVEGLTGGGEVDFLPSAGWTQTEGQFVILTWGSSSCPPVLQDATATGPAQVTATFEAPPADQICTMDMAPRTLLATVTGLGSYDAVELVLTGGEFDNVRTPILG